MPLGVDKMDGEQLRQAARLLERENERLIRQVLELKQQLATAEGKGTAQLELLTELERQLARMPTLPALSRSGGDRRAKEVKQVP